MLRSDHRRPTFRQYIRQYNRGARLRSVRDWDGGRTVGRMMMSSLTYDRGRPTGEPNRSPCNEYTARKSPPRGTCQPSQMQLNVHGAVLGFLEITHEPRGHLFDGETQERRVAAKKWQKIKLVRNGGVVATFHHFDVVDRKVLASLGHKLAEQLIRLRYGADRVYRQYYRLWLAIVLNRPSIGDEQ